MSIDLPLAVWVGAAAALGVGAGTASAAAIARWPSGEPLLRPRPRSAVLAALGGRGFRREALAVEVASGALAGATVAALGAGWAAAPAAVLLVALVPVVVIDLRHRLIPDLVVLPGAALAMAAAVAADPGRWWAPGAAALGAAGFLLLPWLVRPAAMGLGDVKLALLIGAALGASVVAALAVAFAAAAALGAVLAARFGARARRMAVPFGPFLAGGAVVGLVWGPAIIGWCAGTAP
jgi:leader peptidase (prepilin peptidase) / N-methyltransferase